MSAKMARLLSYSEFTILSDSQMASALQMKEVQYLDNSSQYRTFCLFFNCSAFSIDKYHLNNGLLKVRYSDGSTVYRDNIKILIVYWGSE